MLIEEPYPEVWIDESLVVDESAISGKGLFTTTSLEPGRVVIRLGGRLVSTIQLETLLRTAAKYVDTLTVAEDVHLVLPPGTNVHYGNHSCDPNLWHVSPYEIATRRHIDAGQEVTIDYGTQSGVAGFSMSCSCGTDSCRGVITSEDWRVPGLQAAYADHWVPALEERIRNRST